MLVIQRNLFLVSALAVAFVVGACASKDADVSTASDATTDSEYTETYDDSTSDDATASTSSGDDMALNPVYFAYDQFSLSADSRAVLKAHGQKLMNNADMRVVIEGHCDERGTDEYNLALGERRARSIRDYLVNLGVPTSRLTMISYGEERPAMFGSSEEAWGKNRRGEFVISR